MPEGDSIWLVAARLRPLIEGQTPTLRCRWPRVVEGLDGVELTAVQTRGKHLLLRFASDQTLRIHLKMSGRWSFYPDHRYSPEDVGLALEVPGGAAVCRNVPDVERIDDRLLDAHPILSALGPDVLDPSFDPAVAVARADASVPAGELLLDQRVACGIGNVYRSEVLFVERVDPFVPLGDVARPERLWARAARLMRANCRPGPRNTTGRRRPDLYVYGRERGGCLRCGGPISVGRDGTPLQRPVWWCAACVTVSPRGGTSPS